MNASASTGLLIVQRIDPRLYRAPSSRMGTQSVEPLSVASSKSDLSSRCFAWPKSSALEIPPPPRPAGVTAGSGTLESCVWRSSDTTFENDSMNSSTYHAARPISSSTEIESP